MNLRVVISEIDPDSVDEKHDMGITAEAYSRLVTCLSWLGSVEDVEPDA